MARLEMLRGSDVEFRLVWPDVSGQPMNLTDWDVHPFEAHSALDLTLTVGDAAAGEIIGRIEWVDSYQTGDHMGFRVQITKGVDDRSTPQLRVNVT